MRDPVAVHEPLVEHCLTLPGSQPTYPFGEDTLVLKVGGRMFALFDLTGRRGVTLKADPDRGADLVGRHAQVTPGYHLDKRHWVTVALDPPLPDGLLEDLLEESYELVVAGLPRRLRPVPPAPFQDAAAYEAYVGRWSRRVAPLFLDWLDAAPGLRWLDVGCGSGALTQAVLDRCAPASVLAVDPSPTQVAWAQGHLRDDQVRVELGDAAHLPPGSTDVAVSGLVLNFLPDPLAAATAMRDAAGLVAAYVWDYGGGMQLIDLFWQAALELDPRVRALAEGPRALCRPDALAELWTRAGLTDVATTGLDVPTVFADVDDYWRPFLGGQGPAPAYVARLDEEHRVALRELLQRRLPVEPDGSVHLTARAWAVRGRVPG